jgi:1-acyl-sn-glycerol-3-phosphate acyltransferase
MFTDSADEVAFAVLNNRRKAVAQQKKYTFQNRLRLYYRCLLLGVHLVLGVVLSVVCGTAFVQYLSFQQPVIRWWHRRFCNILNLDIRVYGEPFAPHAMWISNHVSWLDIPVLGAHFPVYFLSKAEVASWPVVGWLARAAGTLFIQRGAGDAGNVESRLAVHLQARRNVLFFPEGTTTDGERLKRFFHKLFGAAVKAQVSLQPVLICYRDEHDALHPHAPFIGDDEFMDHALDILKGERMVVDVLVLPTVNLDGRDARTLARDMEAVMSAALGRLHRREF